MSNLLLYFRCSCYNCVNGNDTNKEKEGKQRRETNSSAGKIPRESGSTFMERCKIEAKQSRWTLCETFTLTEIIEFTRKTTRTGNAYSCYEKIQKESSLTLRLKKPGQIDKKLQYLRKKMFLYSPTYCYTPLPKK